VSQENVSVLREMYAATARAGPLALADYLHPDVEWRQLDAEGVTERGRDAVIAARRRWWSEWRSYRVEPREFIDAGDCVLVVTEESGRGPQSDAAITGRFFNVFTLLEGKVVRFEEYRDRAEAFAAAGLPSSG
jgi:ketosteroid isomerase-like protein